MSKIKIKNFGPIKEGYQEESGWLEIKKITIFIGNQGSGKSTIAKTISTLSWLEKAINRGDVDKSKISINKFEELFKYQKINNYFTRDSFIGYNGEKFHILHNPSYKMPNIFSENDKYIVPQIIYIPAERNFLSTIDEAFGVKSLPDTLFSFAQELKKAQQALNGKKLKLPIGDYTYEYLEDIDSSFISGKDYRINLLEASSGLQSYVPLYLVIRNLSRNLSVKDELLRNNLSVNQSIRMNKEISDLMLNDQIPLEDKNEKISLIRDKYYSKCLLTIVEEPEQNLYPISQRKMLNSIIEINNMFEGNKLIITTHSPYLINYLTLAVKAYFLYNKITDETQKSKIEDIVPYSSIVNPEDLVIYELDDKGNISKLGDYKGLPSDENMLNEQLGETDELFAKLLEIQQKL